MLRRVLNFMDLVVLIMNCRVMSGCGCSVGHMMILGGNLDVMIAVSRMVRKHMRFMMWNMSFMMRNMGVVMRNMGVMMMLVTMSMRLVMGRNERFPMKLFKMRNMMLVVRLVRMMVMTRLMMFMVRNRDNVRSMWEVSLRLQNWNRLFRQM